MSTITGKKSKAPVQPKPKAADGKIELSILIPCLNEAETLATCINKASSYLALHDIAGEVLVADNGSSDGSREIAASLGARVVDVPIKGYGAALAGGIEAARGRYIIMGDGDDSYDFTALDPFVEKLRAGFQLVMGNRFAGGIAPGAMPFLHRYLGNPVLSSLGRMFFKNPCRDFHCGLRGFDREAIRGIGLRTTGMEFASEMVVKATLAGLSMTEVPTTLRPDGRSTPPKLRTWRDGWRHMRFLLLFSPRWLFLYPGLTLCALGVGIGAWLLPGPRQLGNITLDIHTLLYAAAAVLVGYQSALFAIFTKVFAITAGLLPEDPRLSRTFRFVTLETGLLAGGVLVLAGIIASILAVQAWGAQSFGALEPAKTLRLVIPAVVSFTLGCQTILASFFLSVLGLSRR